MRGVEQGMADGIAGASRARQWAFILCGVLATGVAGLAPLPYGGVYDTWLLGLIAASLALLALMGVLAERGRGPEWPVLALAIAFPATVAVTAGLQAVLAERYASPVWRGLPIDVEAFATSARGAGSVEMGQALLFALLLMCGHLLGRSGMGLRFLRGLAYLAAVFAVVALTYEVLAPDRLLLTAKRAYAGFLTTPFVNRNTAATFYGSFAVVLTMFAARARLGRSTRLAATADIVALGVTLAALALTGSRAGIALSGLAMIAAYLGTTRGYHRGMGAGRAPFLVIAAVPVVLALIMLSDRFGDESIDGGGRVDTYATTLEMIAERPLQGWGIGTFPHVFPSYRDGPVRGIWDRAHSTPLEWAMEGGIPFALVLLAILAGLGVRCALIFGEARLPYRGTVLRERGLALRPLAGLLVLSLGLAHSCVDFSLDITGYLAPYAFVIGLGSSSVPPTIGPLRDEYESGGNPAGSEHPAPPDARQQQGPTEGVDTSRTD